MSIGLPILSDRPPVATSTGSPTALVDSHGRRVSDLRLSITDRCNFRCTYCLDPGARFLPSDELLSVPELLRLARACRRGGVRRIRITGGEPTVHPELIEIIRGLSELEIEDLSLTTNGWNVDEATLEAWSAAGLNRVTFSLDALEPDRFSAITRSTTPVDRVIKAIRAAARSNLRPVRVNAVIVRGVNEDQIEPLAHFAHQVGIELRYIEFMPLDAAGAWDARQVVPSAEILSRLRNTLSLRPAGREHASSTMLRYQFRDGTPGGIGLIAPVTRPFCNACSRMRITADGRIRPCLFSHQEYDLMPLLRNPRTSESQLLGAIGEALQSKQAGHGIRSEGFRAPERTMSAIGG